MKRVILMLLCCVMLMALRQVGAAQTGDFKRLTTELREKIADTTSSDEVLLESISRLGRISEPPIFWTDIANNTNYTALHRTRAVFALFRRHGEQSGDILTLGKCLAPAKWLNDSTIERVTYVFGHLPIEVNEGESVYSISVLGGPKIYIRIFGDVDPQTFHALLRGNSVPRLKREPIILQIGYGDDYDKWLRPRLES